MSVPHAWPASARCADRSHPSIGWVGHDVQLHVVPGRGQRQVEAQGRFRPDGRLAHRKGSRRERGRRPSGQGHAQCDRYVEYAQANQLGLAHVLLQNRSGRFVAPDAATFQAAAAGSDWSAAADFHVVLTNPAGEQAYPIAATVFVLVSRTAPRARTRATLDFFRWSLRKGSGTATPLGYVPLPPARVQQVEAYWARTFQAGS